MPLFCSHEWEHIPKEIIEPDDEGWETVGKNRSNKLVSSMPSTPKELVAEESLEVISEDVVSIADVPEVVVQDCENDQPCHQDAANQDVEKVGSEKEPSAKEATEDKLSEAAVANTIAASSDNSVISQVQSIDASSSAPGSRKSTLKRPKKKRSSLDGSTSTGGSTYASTLSRPVLISDGDFDVASAAAALRAQKNAFEVLDEAKLKELQDKTVMDTLFVSDIGHGMASGPINLGRFGLGKYIPPDRSEEIYPIPMQQKDEEASEDSEEKANATSSATELEEKPLKSMLEEVLRNAGTRGGVVGGPTGSPSAAKSSLTTYIRDAARFTELAPHSEEHCSAAGTSVGTVPIPGIPSTPSDPLKSKATTVSKKQDDLDLD